MGSTLQIHKTTSIYITGKLLPVLCCVEYCRLDCRDGSGLLLLLSPDISACSVLFYSSVLGFTVTLTYKSRRSRRRPDLPWPSSSEISTQVNAVQAFP